MPVTVLVNVAVAPSCTLVVAGVMVTTIGGGGGAVSVMLAVADEDGVETEVARIETSVDAGMVRGAVYTPVLALILPPPETMDQETAGFELPLTLLVKVCVPPS